jgi:ribosomal protein S18 acetylase RimI-like enzyme
MKLKTLKEHIAGEIEKYSEIKIDQTDKSFNIKCDVGGELVGEIDGFKFATNPIDNIAKDNEEYEFLKKILNVKKVIEIDTLEVKPGFRKMGIGKKLLISVKNIAKNENYDIIYLKARSFGNIPIPLTKLILFYEKQGFQTVRSDKKEYIMIFDMGNYFKENHHGDQEAGKKRSFIYHIEKHNSRKSKSVGRV